MKIITLTLSPAFDTHCHADSLRLQHENLIHMDLCQAGGKGVNISRALVSCGTENLALAVLGEENADTFCRNLTADGVTYEAITVPGRIRENITIHVADGTETRLSYPGFPVTEDLLSQVEEKLMALVDGDTVITMTGRVPQGMAVEDVMALLRKTAEKGAKIVVDSRSFSLEHLKALGPWLIKPNQEEISAYLGREISSLEQTLAEAQALHASGIANVMISMGGDGALLVCKEGAFIAQPPVVEVKSTIGAGDSSIAGFISSDAADPKACLLRAVAYGTAACMTEGTLPPRAEDVAELLPKIQCKMLGV
jgi:1-phosphofructokinase family hexose kinase